MKLLKILKIKVILKIPTLRNINKTSPYFHDASAKTLHDAVSIMMEYQLGMKANKQEIEKIIKFLKH